MSAVVALCEEVTRLLGEDYQLEAMADLLTAELQRQRSTVPILQILGLTVAAILELSREKQNSTERLTTGSTCESTCASVEPAIVPPPERVVEDVAQAIHYHIYGRSGVWDDPNIVGEAAKKAYRGAATAAILRYRHLTGHP